MPFMITITNVLYFGEENFLLSGSNSKLLFVRSLLWKFYPF